MFTRLFSIRFSQFHIARLRQGLRRAASLSLVFLLIEAFDELSYAIEGAALPTIRLDLRLSYAQVGLLLGLPHAFSTLVEPAILLLGDTRLRKSLVVAGGLAIILSLLLVAGAGSFSMLLAAALLSFPASGAFVSLTQATLIDLNTAREPHSMARWTVAGSLGNLLGPLVLAAGFSIGLGWRWIFLALAVLALGLVLAVWRRPFPAGWLAEDRAARHDPVGLASQLRQAVANLHAAVRNPRLLRWLTLLPLSDLMLDIYTGYVPLYYLDVVGATPAQASLLLSILMLAGLAADLILIPLLERLPGRLVVRASAALALLAYPAWLLAPWPAVKVALMIATRLSTLGWYQVLQGEAYAAAPGRSGTVMALNSLSGLLVGAFAWLVGWTANRVGLSIAMWLLLLGPLSLVLFVPPGEGWPKRKLRTASDMTPDN